MEHLLQCICNSHTGSLSHPVLPDPPPHNQDTLARFKYIDDLALTEAVKLSDLETIHWEIEHPVNYHDRTGHYLPAQKSQLQQTFLDVEKYCQIHQMQLNLKKTTTVIFNTSKTKDFTPKFINSHGKVYKNTEEFKLLGVDFVPNATSGLKWDKYINNCIKRAFTNMWILRRLVEMGVTRKHLILTYISRIRVHVEPNTPLWTFSISQELSTKIENVQRAAAFIILGKYALRSYTENISILNLDSLQTRREQICKKFALKTFKHPVHRNMFQLGGHAKTRSGPTVKVPFGRTQRYNRSSIPSLAQIIKSNI